MCENVLNACDQNLIISGKFVVIITLLKICYQEKIIFKKRIGRWKFLTQKNSGFQHNKLYFIRED